MSKRSYDEDEGGSTKRHKENKEERLEIRLLIDAKLSGGIIGKGGEVIKDMRTQCGGWINMGDSVKKGAPFRVVTTQGDLEAVTKACVLISARLAECERDYRQRKGEEEQGEAAFEMVFLIPNSQVGCVIGKAGSVIKTLRENAGGMVKISDDYLEGSDEKTLTLRGTEEQVTTGTKMVCEILEKHRERGTPVHPYGSADQGGGGGGGGGYAPQGYHGQHQGHQGHQGHHGHQGAPPPAQYGYGGGGPPQHQQHHGQGGFGQAPPSHEYDRSRGQSQGGGARGGNHGGQQGHNPYAPPQADPNAPPQTIIIPVPDYLIGTVIGKGGCNIKNIRARSGAQLRVNDLENGATDRMVTITGSRYSNEIAVALVYECMSAYEPRGDKRDRD